MRRTLLLLSTMVVALLLAGGVALAANITCPGGGPCTGTEQNDRITGSLLEDDIQALGGRDVSAPAQGTMMSTAAGAGTTSGAESAETSLRAVGGPTTSTVAQVRPTLARHPTALSPAQ